MRNTRLQSKRESLGLTQAKVASLAKITERAYQFYEAGQKTPSVVVAIRIADALGVENLRELFGANDEMVQRRSGVSIVRPSNQGKRQSNRRGR